MTTPQLDIAIVGAGIAGLVLATTLSRQGHSVTVYERSHLKTSVGFAFKLGPHALRALLTIGVDAIKGGASVSHGAYLRKAHDGSEILFAPDKSAPGQETVTAFRPQLMDEVWDAARGAGVKVEVGLAVKGVDISASKLELSDGRTVEADLIVGADGVQVRRSFHMKYEKMGTDEKQSVIRPAVVDGKQYHPIATKGMNSLRFMLSRSTVENDPVLGPFYAGPVVTNHWSAPPLTSIVTYMTDYERQLNLVCTHPEGLSDAVLGREDSEAAKDYDQVAPKELVEEIHKDFEPLARRHLELADPKSFRIWKLQDMETLPTWSKERTVLVGDAAHVALPFGFNGAAMAVEDGVVLGGLLPRGTRREDVNERLKVFEEMRKSRCEMVRDYARHWKGDKGQMMEYLGKLHPHDAKAEAEAKVKELQVQV